LFAWALKLKNGGSMKEEIRLKKLYKSDSLMPKWIVFEIKNDSQDQSHLIPKRWTKGIIDVDKKRLYSASFKRWFEVFFDSNRKLYYFNFNEERYRIVDSVIDLVDDAITEYYIFGESKYA